MTVNDPQIWTMVGIFAAAMFGTLGLLVPLINRNTRVLVEGLEKVVNAKLEGVEAKFESRFESLENVMNAKFDVVNAKLEHLDRDVTALSKKVFELPE